MDKQKQKPLIRLKQLEAIFDEDKSEGKIKKQNPKKIDESKK